MRLVFCFRCIKKTSNCAFYLKCKKDVKAKSGARSMNTDFTSLLSDSDTKLCRIIPAINNFNRLKSQINSINFEFLRPTLLFIPNFVSKDSILFIAHLIAESQLIS